MVCLIANIPTDTPGTLDWKVDVEEDILDISTKFRFRLIQHTDPPVYNNSLPSRLPSRGFDLYPQLASSASSAAVSSGTPSSSTATQSTATSAISTSASTTNNAQPTSSATTPPQSENKNTNPPNNEDKPSSNTAAIAGGVVGGLAGLALLCGIALLFLRRRKQAQKRLAGAERGEVEEIDAGAPQGFSPVLVWTGSPSELDGGAEKYGHRAARATTTELEGSAPGAAELEGSGMVQKYR